MRKIIFSFLFLSIIPCSFAQVIKKVAVLPPIDKENKVDYIYKHMFRTNMVKAISNAQGYICLNMDVVDEIINVVQFQESGFVKDDEIQNLGMMEGANFICKSEITQKDSNLYISVTITEIEPGITLPGKTDDILTEFEAESIYKACQQLTSKLFDIEVKDNEPKTGTFVDIRDNQTYKWVIIGDQVWMAENLRYASGKYIESNSEWATLEDNNYDAAYCWYDNNQSNKQTYGTLYTYAAAKNACPAGWHLPTDNEWKQLEMHLGMSKAEADKQYEYRGDAGEELKATSGWNSNGNGTDEYGFNALPGGWRDFYNGSFYGAGGYGYWWSATEYRSLTVRYRLLYYDKVGVFRYGLSKSNGYSVRCLKDN